MICIGGNQTYFLSNMISILKYVLAFILSIASFVAIEGQRPQFDTESSDNDEDEGVLRRFTDDIGYGNRYPYLYG